MVELAEARIEAPARARGGVRDVLLLLLVALVVRGAALWLARDAKTWNDQITYVQRAKDLLDGKGYTGSYQPWVRSPAERQLALLPRHVGAYQAPGYSVFIALVCAVTGSEIEVRAAKGDDAAEFKLYDLALPAVQIAQVLLGLATTFLVYWIGRAWFGHAAGLVAGAWFALDPTFVAFTHYYFTETLFVFLFVAAMALFVTTRELPTTGRAIAIGVLFAAAAYVKSSIVLLLPLLAVWFVARHRERAKLALRMVAIAAVAWVLCIAPWTARNYGVHGGLVLLDSSGPFNFWRGNQPWAYQRRRSGADWNVRFAPPFEVYSAAPVSEVGGREFVKYAREKFGTDSPTDLQVMEAGGEAALDYIAEYPGWFVQRAWYKAVDLWNPTSFVMRHLEKHAYGDLSAWLEAALVWACVLSYVGVLAFALPTLWKLANDDRAMLLVLLIGYYTAVHAITFGLTRFRMPVVPFLMVFAGLGVVTAWQRFAERRNRVAR